MCPSSKTIRFTLRVYTNILITALTQTSSQIFPWHCFCVTLSLILFQVTALLALSEGAQFLSNGLLYVTERLRLGPHGATSLVVKLLVTTPGKKNMTGDRTLYG